MIFDSPGPYHYGELRARGGCRGVLGFRCDRVVHHVVALANLFETETSILESSCLQALVYSSARKLSPVVIIAQAILANLLAKATATTRSGFLALMATIHSAKAPLYLWATRNTDVHPTTSILRRYRLPCRRSSSGSE